MEKIKMTFREALVAVFSNILNFSGRARRKESWTFILFYIVIMVGAIALDATMELNAYSYSYSKGPIYIIANIITFLPWLAATIRRLHDCGHSGYYVLWYLVPFIGGFIVFVATLEDSEAGINDYGDSPKYPDIDYEEDYSEDYHSGSSELEDSYQE